MEGLHYAIEWSFMSTLHIVKNDGTPSVQTLCKKYMPLKTNFLNPVKDYVEIENYLNRPKFEFIDIGDVVSTCKCCEECFKKASLILMSSQS